MQSEYCTESATANYRDNTVNTQMAIRPHLSVKPCHLVKNSLGTIWTSYGTSRCSAKSWRIAKNEELLHHQGLHWQLRPDDTSQQTEISTEASTEGKGHQHLEKLLEWNSFSRYVTESASLGRNGVTNDPAKLHAGNSQPFQFCLKKRWNEEI